MVKMIIISEVLSTYNPDFHVDNGFDRDERCKLRSPRGGVDSRMSKEGEKTHHETQCCGEGLGRVVFKIDRFECCADGHVKPIGQC